MSLPQPVPGLVIRYAYLWRDEANRGRSEGTKDRPCVVVLAIEDKLGDQVVTVAPITHAPPDPVSLAVEIPEDTKKRLGLDSLPSWIVTRDLNRFVWPGPDLRPLPGKRSHTFAFGLLPPKLFSAVKAGVLQHVRQGSLAMVRRDP